MTLIVLPDVEQVVTGHVRSHADLPEGVVVAAGWYGYQAGQTRVVLSRAGGGTWGRHRIDRARIDVEVVAPDKATAVETVQAVRAILAAAPGSVSSGSLIVNTSEESGPTYLEDQTSDSPRYVASWIIDVRPDP